MIITKIRISIIIIYYVLLKELPGGGCANRVVQGGCAEGLCNANRVVQRVVQSDSE